MRGAHVGGDAGIVAGLEQIAAHQVGAHADAGNAGVEPGFERGFGSFHAAGGHDGDPGARSLDRLDEGGAADFFTGEDLDDFAAEFLGLRDFRRAAATGRVGDLAAVAGARDIGIQHGPDDEIGAAIDVEGGGAGVYDGADAEDHLGQFAGAVLLQFVEDLPGMVAAVGELQQAAAAGNAGRGDFAGDLEVWVVKDGYEARVDHRVKDF